MTLDLLKFVLVPKDFPDITDALLEPDGLLAYSHNLTSELLIHAYSSAIFPWYESSQPILWWSPTKRAVLYPSDFKIRKSLKQTIKKNDYRVSINKDFNAVIENCAKIKRKQQTDTWITTEMISHYQQLHRKGIAHSVECWQQDKLVGGLYGIYSQGLFCGESMFSLASDASKTCLLGLAQNAQQLNIHLIDCQIMNPFLESLGVIEIQRSEFCEHFDTSKSNLNLSQFKQPLSTL